MEFALVWKALSSYGVLGIMCLVFMAVIGKLYRDREAERERHRAELAAYRDRYEIKAEKSAEKIAALVEKANAAADEYERRRWRARGADAPP